jgi:Phosphotransferase enzyme family
MSGGEIDLALSGRDSVDDAISCIPAVASGRWRLLGVRFRRVLSRIGKRVSILSVTFLDEGSGLVIDDVIVVKEYDGEGAPGAHDALITLWRAGFRSPSFHRVPRPYGFSAGGRQVVEQFVPGPSLIQLVRRSNGAALAGVWAMEWLLQLQSTELVLQRDGPDPSLAASVGQGMEQLQPVVSCLRTELTASADPMVPSHGDFHLKNLLRHKGSIVSIDVDKLGTREASFDVGDAIGQLIVMSHFGHGTLARGVEAAAAMWNRYRESGVATAERIVLHAARSIIKSLVFKYRLAQAAGEAPPVLHPWIAIARHCLEARDPEELWSFVSRVDFYRR